MSTERENTVRQAADDARQALHTVVDEMKLKAHLASMEAQDALERLEPQLRKVESRLSDYGRRLSESSDRAELDAHLAMMDARDRWEAMREDVDRVVFSIKRRGEDARQSFDQARLQTHLARLDAADAAATKAKELEATWNQRRDEVYDQASAFIERMVFNLEQMRDKLRDAVDGEDDKD